MKKNLIPFLSIVFLTIVASCTQENAGTKSYAMIVVINGYEYNFASYEVDASMEIGKRIGIIEKKTERDEAPTENQSNFFEAGSKVHAVKGTDEYIIVIDNENKKTVLKKVP
jgi:hypothetical protein